MKTYDEAIQYLLFNSPGYDLFAAVDMSEVVPPIAMVAFLYEKNGDEVLMDLEKAMDVAFPDEQ